MKIYNIPSIMKAYNQKKLEPKAGPSSITNKKDASQVSHEAQLMNSILKAAKKAPEIREEKVQNIKSALNKGTYHVSSDEVAQKMLKGIMLDKKG